MMAKTSSFNDYDFCLGCESKVKQHSHFVYRHVSAFPKHCQNHYPSLKDDIKEVQSIMFNKRQENQINEWNNRPLPKLVEQANS